MLCVWKTGFSFNLQTHLLDDIILGFRKFSQGGGGGGGWGGPPSDQGGSDKVLHFLNLYFGKWRGVPSG